MNHFFLYRLFKHSKWAFACCALFIIFYAIVFYKKMDMVFFPYNSMYTIDFTKTNTATTYAMKINGNIVDITRHPYWKKDFLETSLFGYCKYLRHNRTIFLEDYLRQRFSNEGVLNILLAGLTADKTATAYWPRWFGRFAGYDIPANATIELLQYNFKYERGRAIITDSISMYKAISP